MAMQKVKPYGKGRVEGSGLGWHRNDRVANRSMCRCSFGWMNGQFGVGQMRTLCAFLCHEPLCHRLFLIDGGLTQRGL